MTPNTGGPAFPHGPLGDLIQHEDGQIRYQRQASAGMDLLDWMAGQALAGYVAHNGVSGNFDEHADQCYAIASAMLAEKARREAAVQPAASLGIVAHERDQALNRMANLEAKAAFLEKALREAAATLDKESNPVATKLFAAMARSKGMA